MNRLIGAGIVFFVIGAFVTAQERTSGSDELEQMIAAALKSHPEILVAEAKLHEAEAELNRVKAKVAQEVIAWRHQKSLAEAAVRMSEQDLQKKQQMVQQGVADRSAVMESEFAFIRARADLDNVDALGRYIAPPATETRRPNEKAGGPAPSNAKESVFSRRPNVSPELSAILDVRLNVTVGSIKIGDFVAVLQNALETKGVKGLTFSVDEEIGGYEITGDLKEKPLGDILTYVADRLHGDVVFVFRSYGVYVTSRSNAQRLWGAAIPAETPVLAEVAPPTLRGVGAPADRQEKK